MSMTHPQSDPAVNPSAAIARLAEQAVSFQRQIDNTHAELLRAIQSLSDLTEARFVTYRTLIDSQAEKVALALDASERAISKQEDVTQRALNKQETATEKRFEGVNAFRQQLNDQARTFMPRTEVDALGAQWTTRMRELNDLVAGTMTRTEALALAERNAERIQELTDRMNRSEGQHVGAKDNKAGIYAAIGALAVVITVVVLIANFMAAR
jgi:exonuclease VII large subunit